MKIAFDVSYIQKNRAGIGRYALELLRALLAEDSTNEYVLHGWSFSLDTKTILGLQNAHVRFSLARIPGFIKRDYWNWMSSPPIELFAGECDVFHSSDPLLPPTRRAKTISTVHDVSYKKFPHFFEGNVLRLDGFIRRSIRNADAILVPSEQTKHDLLELFGAVEEKIHVVHPPVHSIFKPLPEDIQDEQVRLKYRLSPSFLLFVGTLEPRKNIVGLIKAYERVGKENGNIQLVIVGKKGWFYSEIIKGMNASPVRSSIRYLEYVSDEELASLYRMAHCLVYPSFYEGYGLPILEAMASGTPVITSNTSSMKEIAGGCAVLIDPEKNEDLVNAIRLLVDDASLCKDLRVQGLVRVQQYSGEVAARKVLGVYEQLLQRS